MRDAIDTHIFGCPEFGQSEIEQLDTGLGDHDVGRLEVSMHDALTVRSIQGRADVDGVLEDMVESQ